MQKEKLNLINVKTDLSHVLAEQTENRAEARLTVIIPIAALAAVVGFLLDSVWIGVAIFALSFVEIYRYAVEKKEQRGKKKALEAALEKGDLSIAVKTLSHVAKETVYEPYTHTRTTGTHAHATKTITVFHFEGGGAWRVPKFDVHYPWSAAFYLSAEGLENTSVGGNEFFYISLQGHYEISYVYPCKFFELDESLKKEP
ncbi:MAG: hypothetical protein IJV96_07915 [Clostridia bacterium]|nr:hypothetical protein [Clostridia bacterium]